MVKPLQVCLHHRPQGGDERRRIGLVERAPGTDAHELLDQIQQPAVHNLIECRQFAKIDTTSLIVFAIHTNCLPKS
jgi:hypothetical protein